MNFEYIVQILVVVFVSRSSYYSVTLSRYTARVSGNLSQTEDFMLCRLSMLGRYKSACSPFLHFVTVMYAANLGKLNI